MESNIIENFGIYIHFPFCKRKCLYCDFYSVGERLADWDKYAAAVEDEFKGRSIPADATVSLYMGGGTPSLAPAWVIARFRDMIANAVGEFTIEVNPDDVTEEKAREWREAGVNRVSMGVQTLNDGELKVIGRRHSARTAREAYSILRKYFSNISLDLIFGLPGQSLASLEQTIDAFIEMRPEHISAYSLMYEERAALTRLRDSGRIEEIGEEDSVEMFRLLTSRLRNAGYVRYEISNYALPGYRSHHNSNYWRGVPYIGLGPSAHSYEGDSTRRHNASEIDNWEVADIEHLSEEELREEMILTRLRMSEGLDLEEYAEKFGASALARLEEKAHPFLKSGQLYFPDPFHLALTDEGVMVSDEIIVALL